MAESVVLMGIGKKGADDELLASLEELQALTETAGGSVAAVLHQRVERFDPGTLIGEGKVAELAQAVRENKARTVVFDAELSPAQQKKLEDAVKVKILDRTRLILDIFAKRARTREGEFQVELAQLSYMLPRLTGSWRAYSQQVGGIGTRGPGERQLEYERRHIHRRIEYLKRAIERIKRERAVRRSRRQAVPVPQVAIIGYTNAGKSTLLNALTQEVTVYADDKLFATLDPTARRVRLPGWGWIVFTDTVGFIQRLPTTLVAAFRSTLEEVALADCLVHVMDAASPHQDIQKRAVEDILRELGAERIPRVEVVNKSDLLPPEEARKWKQAALLISARQKTGLTALLKRIEDALQERWMLRELELAPSQTRAIREAYECAAVLDQSFRGGKTVLRLRITPENWSRLKKRAA